MDLQTITGTLGKSFLYCIKRIYIAPLNSRGPTELPV